MSRRIPESELIINPDGSIYHLNIHSENLADTILIVGDPKRVEMISEYFDHIEFKGSNREIQTHTGIYKNKRITAMSTGMGTDNIDIVLNELDALVNIDFVTRTEKQKKTSLNIIRLGTSGALQPDIPANATIMSLYGLGLDGLLYYYAVGEGIIERELTEHFIKTTQWPDNLPKPYVTEASNALIALFERENYYQGITVTAPGFYGPQGRELRIKPGYGHLNQSIREVKFGKLRVMNFEMETSALYGLGKLLGHNTLTLCIAIASRVRHDHSKNYHEAMQNLIIRTLDIIAK